MAAQEMAVARLPAYRADRTASTLKGRMVGQPPYERRIVMEWISGKKTYILTGCGVIVVGLWMFGVIETQVADYCLAALGFGSLAALRAGIRKA